MKKTFLAFAFMTLVPYDPQALADGVVAARKELNYQPTAIPDVIDLIEGDTVELELIASDTESQPLTFTIIDPPSFGNLLDFNPSTGTLRYASLPGVSGIDSFTFAASDGITTSDPATVSLSITPFSDFIFANGFESGDLSGWSSTSP